MNEIEVKENGIALADPIELKENGIALADPIELKENGIALADPIELKENITITSFDADGNVLKVTEMHNLITKVGRENLAIRIGNTTQGNWTDIQLGTSTQAPASTDTVLIAPITTANGLQRAAATFSVQDNGSGELSTCQWSITFTKTDAGTTTVQEMGVFNAGNKLLARSLTGAHAISQNGGITIVHKIPLS